MVTLREGGQSLDVDAEQLGEGLRLGVTELGELGRDVLHRAVALAQLDAGERRGTGDGDGSRARGIPSRWRAVTRAAVRSATGAFASGICS